jgi:RNA polymerase sigma-70 factor (ECF subfamily)
VDARSIGELYRKESGAIVARMIRVLGGDFSLAEEVVQEAFEAALAEWPNAGAPGNERAWLFSTARHKAIDRLRRRARFEAPLDDGVTLEALATEAGEEFAPGGDEDQLRLIFTCCHPALALDAQVALTLRTLCGLTTDEIARAFLVETKTMAQRLVRAQNKIRIAKIPYVVPERAELGERLDAVLGVVYLVFNEGYAATAGDALVRHELCREAIRIGRLVERLMPERAEPVALVALMLLHDARREARVDAAGDLVLLEEQQRSRWDRAEIDEGLERVERALRLGGATPYALQAAIAALHAQAPRAEVTDWGQIVLLYDALVRLTPTPVVRLNRAVAVAMRDGPERGLALLGELADEPDLEAHHLFFAARADLARRLGRYAAARADYARALELCRAGPERRYLERRLDEVARPDGAGR